MATTHRFGASDAQRLDRQYAAPFMVEQRRRTLAALALQPGESAIDIGCGPGYLTLEMAKRVGRGGRVLAVDSSAPMLEVARQRCAETPWVEFHHTDVANLPCADASIDVAVAVQVCLFVADLDRVLGEMSRVLRPGGRVVLVDTDWDSAVWHSSDAQRMQRFMDVWVQRFANARVARLFPGALRHAGFQIEQAAVIPMVELDAGADTHGGSQLPEVARYVTGKSGISADEAQAWAQDLLALAAEGRYFYGLGRYLFVGRKPA